MRRVLGIIVLVTCGVGPFALLPSYLCLAQKPQPDYDYRSLAVASILTSAEEASKLSDIEQRITLLVMASELLPSSKREDEIRLLELALRDLKEWTSDEKAGWGRRYTAATLRNQILSAYAKLDIDRVSALRKESQPEADSNKDPTSVLRNGNWSAEMLSRGKRADETAKIALSIMGTDFEKASALILQSVQSGVVSSTISDIFQKLLQDGSRLALNKLESSIGQILAHSVSLDPLNLRFVPILVQSDRDMPAAARSGFQLFFLNSLRAWVDLALDANNNGALDPSYVSSSYLAFVLSVRPVMANGQPEQLMTFDLLLDQVSPLVPDKAKSLIQSVSPEAIVDPKDRLGDILKGKSAGGRDIRLMRFVLDLVRKSVNDYSQIELDLAADAISHVSDARLKTTLSDFLTITQLSLLAKQGKFIDASRVAESIASTETRAWALLALSSAVAKQDRVLGFEFVSDAMKCLDLASPSPKKVELALMASALLAKDDPRRAFEILSVAAKYANSSPSNVKQGQDLAGGIRLKVVIENFSTLLANAPESLGEIEINKSLSLLAKADWFGSQSIADDFRDPRLRLSLKLAFARGVLASEPKSTTQKSTRP
ncbi:MAG: hypothetical protein QOF62_3791 [Pyrinomonadaceae bacterium]|nr:hypothetical protein [Pyrinomonadaceae bacterium]